MRILIIEDSARFALELKTLLEAQGHQTDWIVGVESVDEAHTVPYPG